MKGKRSGKATGGVNEAKEDLDKKNMRYTYQSKVNDEAEERKDGGRAKRKSGGVVHHEKMDNMKHAKHVGNVQGCASKPHGGRKPRKSGGRASSDSNPFSSARSGTAPKGHTVEHEGE